MIDNEKFEKSILREIAVKQQEVINNIFNIVDKDYISKEKIKEKVKELEKEYKDLEIGSDFIIADTIQPKIQVLKELLEN